MSWQNNNQHLRDWCRPTSMSATIVCPLSMMMVLILKVNDDIKPVDITREMNDKNFWGLCVCHNQNVSTVNDESHNGQRTDNSTDRATPDRHPLTVVIVRKCSYVWVTRGGLWIKYPPRQWLGATKLRNLLRLPFSLFNPLFGLAGQGGDPDMHNVPQNFAESLVCLLPTVLIVF